MSKSTSTRRDALRKIALSLTAAGSLRELDAQAKRWMQERAAAYDALGWVVPVDDAVDPAQQRMMMLMPLMFGFMFYYSSSGLVLYWLTGNLVGIAQQLLFNKPLPWLNNLTPNTGVVVF